MNKIKNLLAKLGAWIKDHKLASALLALVLIFLFLNIRSDDTQYQSYHVSKTDVIDTVELTGSVSAVDRADLSFQATGTVSSILVTEGENVSKGEIIARLDGGSLSAELAQARAGVQSAQAILDQALASLDAVRAGNVSSLTTVEAAQENLKRVVDQQDQLVENAHRELLSNDLQAYPVDPYKEIEVPTISGSYLSDEEGSYHLDFYRSGSASGFSARYSGLENGVVSFVGSDVAMPLGSRGLYISLPDTLNSYTNTDFVVPIPNTRSASYQTKISALEAAKETRRLQIASAQAELDRLQSSESNNYSLTSAEERQALAAVASAQAGMQSAQAAVAIIESRLSDRVIIAPFSGVIGRLDLQIGENVAASQIVATLVSDGNFEIELQVPEIDVARLQKDMEAMITLDAYNDAALWQGRISSIEQIETIVEGVPVYITTVTITNPDDRIKIGMNARAEIELDRATDVVAVPKSYIFTDNGRSYVLVKAADGSVAEQTVKTGLVGADSLVQIIEGLSAGTVVVKEIENG